MEEEKTVKDVLLIESLQNDFINMAIFNRSNRIRSILTDKLTESRRGINPQNIEQVFFQRGEEFLERYYRGEVSLIDLFEEKTIMDVLQLYFGDRLNNSSGRCEDVLARIRKILNDKIGIGYSPKKFKYDKDFCNGFRVVEDEDELDRLLVKMMSEKMVSQGRIPIRYTYFILKQCFYDNSAIMKNKGKYENVIYRFLEEFAKREAVSDSFKMEMNLFRRLDEHNRGRNPQARQKNTNVILSEIKELVRRDWVFEEKTAKRILSFMNEKDLDEDVRKKMELLLEKAQYSSMKDIAPIVVTQKNDEKDFKGFTKKGFISLQEKSMRKMVYGTREEKIDVLDTLFHENTHIRQIIDFSSPNTYLRYIEAKINMLINEKVIDKELNYYTGDLREREAYLRASEKTLKFLSETNIMADTETINLNRIMEENKIKALLSSCIPIEVKEGNKTYKKSLFDIFDDYVKKKMYETSRESLDEEIEGGWYDLILREEVIPEYENNPDKKIAVDDYLPGANLLKDNPIFRIEYDDEGNRRDFGNFLRNAKKIISEYRFLESNENEKVDFIVDNKIVKLIKDIISYNYMQIDRLPEVLHCLSRTNIQYDKNDSTNKNEMFDGFIRGVTLDNLGSLFVDATERINELPDETIKQSVLMCGLIHLYINEEREKKLKRSEFIEGLLMKSDGDKSIYDKMLLFEEKAKEVVGKDFIETTLKEYLKKRREDEVI